ncbi:hypothetical protein GINT2_002212 [Glugoides intestinalis]
MRFSSILIVSTLISCRVSPVEMQELVQEFKDEKDGIISSLNLNYENSLLNPMIGEPYKCTGLISNLRFFGPGIISGSIAKTTQRSYPNDKSNHPLIQFIIKLFPSPAGTLNHLCTHATHLTKLFVESNPDDKIKNASNLLVCSITGESFEYTGEGINEDIKRLEEDKEELKKRCIHKEKEIVRLKEEEEDIENNISDLYYEMDHTQNEDDLVLIEEELRDLQANLKEVKNDLEKLKEDLLAIFNSQKIEVLNKNIKNHQEIEEKRKSEFKDLGTAMSKALKNNDFHNPQLLLTMIIHEFVKSAFTIGELKEYMHKSLIKIEEKVSEKAEILDKVKFLDRLRVLNTDVDWADALVKIYLTNNTFPYSRFNLPVSNISIPSYIRGKDGKEEQFDENNLFADCADVAIMQLCNCLLFNTKDKICKLSHLEKAKLEPELEDFYKTHSNPFASTTLEKRKDWSKVVQDRRDLTLPDNNDFQTHRIIYNRDNRNEIYSGLINMMSVLALIFGIDRNPIFDGLDEGNILKRFEKLLQAVAIPGMSVEIDKAGSDTLKSSVINSRSHSRTEFFGKVNIKFSYKDDRENESRTTMAIKHKESHTDFMFVQNNSKEIDLSNEIERLGNSSGFKKFSFPFMINRVFLMAGNNPLPKGNVLEGMYASGLVESNKKKLEMLKTVYENMPKDRNQEGTGIFNSETPEGTNEWNDFTSIIDSILENVPLEDLAVAVFNKFAPFLLYSEKHKEKLNGFDLRLVYESKNEKLKEHWIDHADEKLGSLRFSFNIAEINDDEGLKKIEFCNNFSKLTKLELFYKPADADAFDKSKTWSNSMKVLKEIPTCTEIELFGFDSDMLKDFIDGAATSKLEVLQQLNKLKIVFNDESGIRYINSAVKNFPYLPNLSEITIENQATTYTPGEGHESGNLVKLIKGLPTDRKIEIKLIGSFIESEIFNALKETPEKVEVSIVYKLDSFNKEYARILRDKIEDPKLNIKIFSTRNGIERHLPITTEILENLLKAKDFFFSFGSKQHIEFDHTNVNVFLSLLDPFFQEREWVLVNYRDNNPRTEICELPEFVKAFNTSESIRFGSNFLDISNENDTNDFISVVNRRNKWFILNASELLIDSENLITIYNKMQEKRNFTVEANSWLIRVRKGKVDTFKDKFEQIYKKVCPGGLYQNEFLEKIEALSKLSELDVFTINLRNKDVLYIGDGIFRTVFQMLPTIKNRFEKVIVAKDAFTKYQFSQLRDELRKDSDCTLETGTEESLLNPWLTSKNYLIRLFLWLKPIFRYYS